MVLRKKSILLIMVFLIGCFVCACGKEKSVVGETLVEDTEEVSSTEETKSVDEEAAEQWEKGYGLPVDEQEEKEAANDCKKMMELIFDIYKDADKGTAFEDGTFRYLSNSIEQIELELPPIARTKG